MWKSSSMSFLLLMTVLLCHCSAQKLYRVNVCLWAPENLPICNFTINDVYAPAQANYVYPIDHILIKKYVPYISFEKCWYKGLKIYGHNLVVGVSRYYWIGGNPTNITRYPTLDNFSSGYLDQNKTVVIVAHKCYPQVGLILCPIQPVSKSIKSNS